MAKEGSQVAAAGASITTWFHLSRIPVGSIKAVDLEDEVLLYSLQPLNSDTLIRHPGDRSQVVFTESEKEERWNFLQCAWFPSTTPG